MTPAKSMSVRRIMATEILAGILANGHRSVVSLSADVQVAAAVRYTDALLKLLKEKQR